MEGEGAWEGRQSEWAMHAASLEGLVEQSVSTRGRRDIFISVYIYIYLHRYVLMRSLATTVIRKSQRASALG